MRLVSVYAIHDETDDKRRIMRHRKSTALAFLAGPFQPVHPVDLPHNHLGHYQQNS